MENPKNNLTVEQRVFFDKLKNYINIPIYFYGSINRDDYFPGKSDIDIAIFSHNELSTIYTLCNFFGVEKKKFRKSVNKIKNKIIIGYKMKYEDVTNNINTEISIFNEKDKDIILDTHNKHLILPFYMSFLIKIIKILYYNLGLISKDTFKLCKRNLMNENGERQFILLDIK
jgi:predicted nucleotidyltransferase